jgi:hypothetical protein
LRSLHGCPPSQFRKQKRRSPLPFFRTTPCPLKIVL